MTGFGMSKADVDCLTIAQGTLLLKEARKIEKRRNANLAFTIVACAFDKEAWANITKEI
jgi:hypothetical protein